MLTQGHWKRALGVGERVCAGERNLVCLQEAGGLHACALHTPAVGFVTSSLFGERDR